MRIKWNPSREKSEVAVTYLDIEYRLDVRDQLSPKTYHELWSHKYQD